MFQLVSAYIQKQLCWCSANACLERLEPARWISPSVSASLLKHSGPSQCGIRKMSCFVFQTLILSRSVKLAIRKVSEIKCWDSWIQWTLRNRLHYISCDLRELRRVFLSCRLFWNINTNISHTLITCSLFSLIIFESLVSEHLITLSSIQKITLLLSVSVKCFGKDWAQELQISQKAPAPILAACYFLAPLKEGILHCIFQQCDIIFTLLHIPWCSVSIVSELAL